MSMNEMLKNYDEIFKIRAEGLCESCSHGFETCIDEGQAFCKCKNTSSKEVTVCEQEEFI